MNISIKEYLNAVKKRPEMYIDELNYKELIKHINNFISFKKIFNLNDLNDKYFIQNFPKWVCKKYEIKHTFEDKWNIVILLNSINDIDAITNFFRLFDEFNEEKQN